MVSSTRSGQALIELALLLGLAMLFLMFAFEVETRIAREAPRHRFFDHARPR